MAKPVILDRKGQQHPSPARSMTDVMMQTSAGNIRIRLFTQEAPETTGNFLKLVDSGFYDGLHFHRVIEQFMIQGGCPNSKDPMSRSAGTGGPGWKIPCETSALNMLHDRPGVLSMANSGPNTGGSQFFLTTVATPWLNGGHAIFGEVVEGMDVVKTIEDCRKLPGDRPAQPQQMISVTRA
jgi:cyclophilin family peptidyl-prolyl cis-trans isomerase